MEILQIPRLHPLPSNCEFLLKLNLLFTDWPNSKSKICYDWRSVGQSVLLSSPHLGHKTISLLLSDSCWFVAVGRPLWREDGSVVYNRCWFSPAQSLSVPGPAGLMTIFYCLRFETPQTWMARSPYLYPQEQGGPVIHPGTSSPFRRLLRLAGLWWKYSNPHTRGDNQALTLVLAYNISARTTRKTLFLCGMHIRCRRSVFPEPFPGSGRLFLLINNLLPSNGRRSVICFAAIA
jgi:hypothetical protein